MFDLVEPTSSQSESASIVGNAGWYRSPVSVALSSVDNPTIISTVDPAIVYLSGEYRTYYRLNNGGVQHYFSPFILSQDGIYTVSYWSEDFAANTENSQNRIIRIDQTPPETNDALAGTMGLNDWWISDVTVSLTATDNLSGVDETFYKIDGGIEQTYTSSFVLTEDGIHTVQYRSRDISGNLEDWNSIEIKIDQTPPVIDIESDKDVYTRVESVVFDIDVFDPVPGSGLWQWWASFNGLPIDDGSEVDIFWLDLGTYNYEGWAQDFAGLTSTDGGSITLIATLESLPLTVARLCLEGHIGNGNANGNSRGRGNANGNSNGNGNANGNANDQGNANSGGNCNAFQSKIANAIASVNRDNNIPAINQLNAVLHQLDAQRGHNVSEEAFRIFNQDVIYVIGTLNGTVTRIDNTISAPIPSLATVVPTIASLPAPESTTTGTSELDVESSPVPTTTATTMPSATMMPTATASPTVMPTATMMPTATVMPTAIPSKSDLTTLLDQCVTSDRQDLDSHVSNSDWNQFRQKVDLLHNGKSITTDCATQLIELANELEATNQ